MSAAQIEEALQEAAEAGQLLQKDGPLPLGSGIDLLPHLARLQTEGLRLEAEVLRDVRSALESAAVCRNKLLSSEVCPSSASVCQTTDHLSRIWLQKSDEVSARVRKFLIRLLLNWLSCADGLKGERNRVKRQLERLLQDERLQGVFQEALITDRNGRYVAAGSG